MQEISIETTIIQPHKIKFMQPFSVLMSVYHLECPEYLQACLESIFSQTAPASEIILVKDGPLTNDLEEIIAGFSVRYPELKTVDLPVNVGLGRALNEGLKHCSYELVARMDTDDICKPRRFERQIQAFAENPEIDVCSSWIDEFEKDIRNIESQRRLPERHEQIARYAKSRCPVNHPVVMYRKSRVMEVGGYYGFPEDSHLWVKLLMNGARFHNLQESLLWFRISKDMFKRRGGWKYAKDDLLSQWRFHQEGFLSFPEFLKNIMIRGTVRIMPNGIRTWVYKKLLRNR